MLKDGERIESYLIPRYKTAVAEVFEPVLDDNGKTLLNNLLDTFENNQHEHINFTPLTEGVHLEHSSGNVKGPIKDCNLVDVLVHVIPRGWMKKDIVNIILKSTDRIASREDIIKHANPKTKESLLSLLEKYKGRGHVEFPVIAQNLIDGKPAGVYRKE